MKPKPEIIEHGWTLRSGHRSPLQTASLPKPRNRPNTTKLFNALSRQRDINLGGRGPRILLQNSLGLYCEPLFLSSAVH
jgi:hypothetical protein